MRTSVTSRSRAFTLLELIIAVTLLAVFLLPMMLIITKAKVRAIQYTQQRQVRDLAQRKLFDVIHYYDESRSGDFSLDGHPQWLWQVDPPELMGQNEPVLLQYTIHVQVPQKIQGSKTGGEEGEGSTYSMSLWTFPDIRWYEEQDLLFEQGQYSPLYGDPRLGGAMGTYGMPGY